MRCNNWVLKDTYPQHEGCFHKINSGSHSIYKPAWSCIICSISNNAEDIPLRNEFFLNCGSDSITFKLKHATVFYAITNDPGYGVSFCSMWFLEPMSDVFFSLFRVTTHDFLNVLLMWPLILIVMNACYFSIMYFGWSQLDALSLVYTLTLPRHNLDNAIITVCNSFLLICNYVLRWPL